MYSLTCPHCGALHHSPFWDELEEQVTLCRSLWGAKEDGVSETQYWAMVWEMTGPERL